MATAEGTLYFRTFDRNDPRLGRQVLHDSRSRRFAAPARDPATLKSTRHEVYIDILRQLNEGSCTGNAGENNLASGLFWVGGAVVLQGVDHHEFARQLYADATKLDPWEGEFDPATGVVDTGSDGLSIAKVLLARGLISGYQHAFSLAATLTALAEQVVMIGSSWRRQMFDPAPDGRLLIDGPVDGGHEYALDELDVERERVWIRNSWGEDWGQGGRAWLSWDDLGTLLADDGDCTILMPRSQPAPTPQPVPPKPSRPAEDVALAAAIERWQHTSAGPSYLRKAATDWLTVFKE